MTQECCEQSWTSPGGNTPTRHQTVRPPVRRTRHVGHCWRSRDELISDVLLWTPTHGRAKAERPARTYIQHVRIRDVVQKTCLRRWTIRESGERGSGISVLPARQDDDDDDDDKCQTVLFDSSIRPYLVPPLRNREDLGVSTIKLQGWNITIRFFFVSYTGHLLGVGLCPSAEMQSGVLLPQPTGQVEFWRVLYINIYVYI